MPTGVCTFIIVTSFTSVSYPSLKAGRSALQLARAWCLRPPTGVLSTYPWKPTSTRGPTIREKNEENDPSKGLQ